MRIGKRYAGGIALMATAALTLAACGGGSTTDTMASGDAPATELGGEINAGVAYETTDYSSITSSALAVGSNLQVLEGLYQLDMSTYKPFPALASGDPVAVSDTEYEITLRDGAKFSDGKDVTTEDVLSSYGRTTAEGSIYGQFFDFVKSVTAKDDKTITVELNYPFANLAARFADMKVVPTAMTDDELKAHPIGTGPYKYESITPTEITAVPNEFYNGAHPATSKTLRWHVLKDDSARLAAALDGTTDVMEAVPASAVDQLKAAGWTVDSVPGYGNPFLMFNMTKAPFNDAKVRQAIHKAIDKQKLIEVGMEGEAVEATSFLPESNPAYKKTATQLSYDLEGAKALLAEAGVSGLTVNLVTTDHPWITNLVPQIKSDLEALGLTVNHSPMASADLYANVTDVDEPTYDIVFAPGDPSVFGADPGIILSWWNGDNVWTQKRTFWQKADPESFQAFQTLFKDALQLDGDAAKQKWGEAQDLLAEQAVVYPLFHKNMLTAYNGEKLDGFKSIAATGIQLIDVKVK